MFLLLSALGWLTVVVRARLARGKLFSAFSGVMIGIYTLLAIGLRPAIPDLSSPITVQWVLAAALFGGFHYAHAVVYVHFFALANPQFRGLTYRIFISFPASFMLAGTLLGLPWALLRLFGITAGAWFPYLLAILGLASSFAPRKETIPIRIDRKDRGPLARVSIVRNAADDSDALRIIQLTDTHLGPFMSVAALRGFAERAVAKDPDLVLLTGDFLTMESQGDVRYLRDALAPLAALRGRVVACWGNHDYESPAVVDEALASIGAIVLKDAGTILETRKGRVQIVGFEFRRRDRERLLREVCTQFPREEGVPRLLLLHDPSAIRDLPEGEGDLIFSGHMHGGQLGFVFAGGNGTFLSLLNVIDHGLWSRGRDLLYAHRGTGHYGFPIRLGVPAEESLLLIRFASEG